MNEDSGHNLRDTVLPPSLTAERAKKMRLEQLTAERGEAIREVARLVELLCATLPTENEEYQRKLIEEFLDFFLGKSQENQKDWSKDFVLGLFGITRKKLIDDFFNSRK